MIDLFVPPKPPKAKKKYQYSTPRYSVSRAKVFTQRAIKHREYMRKRRQNHGLPKAQNVKGSRPSGAGGKQAMAEGDD